LKQDPADHYDQRKDAAERDGCPGHNRIYSRSSGIMSSDVGDHPETLSQASDRQLGAATYEASR
jgi:hypothetical protein